jgi:Ni2+-binding GTPase involved in maturation of urease and hydrogenase
MQIVTVSGPPSSGKTSVLIGALKNLHARNRRVGVVKFDCLTTSDDSAYAALDIPVRVGLSGNVCPDHFFVSNIEACCDWGLELGLDLLVSESAGLCNRCSPHIRNILAVCVIDNLMGLETPRKIGPMLKFADIVVITKFDIVSQAEREVFAFGVRQVNPRARILHVNGVTGQGSDVLADLFADAPAAEDLAGRSLRFTMPAALCSYCLGETRIGAEHQLGNIKKMK